MSEFSKSTVIIEASLPDVQRTLTELDRYPDWSTQIKTAESLSTDDQGRITKIKMSIDAGMMKDRVTLDYDWSAAPLALSFSMDEADLLTQMDGTYTLKSIDEDTTQVTYELSVAVSLPVPSMMITKGQQQIIDAALKELASRVS